MFEDDFDLGLQVDVANEVKEMEQKATILSIEDRYMEFSEMVLNSFKLMEQKFHEMETRVSKALQQKNKENNTQVNVRQKSVSVGKISAPSKTGKMSLSKFQPIKKQIFKPKK